MKKVLLFGVIAFLLFLVPQVQSQEFGTDSEGRAYRIDRNGLQIFDELAETAATNSELKRQITTLENEIKEKQGIINNYAQKYGTELSTSLSEEDLTSNETKTITTNTSVSNEGIEEKTEVTGDMSTQVVKHPENQCPEHECPAFECPSVECPNVECPSVKCPAIEEKSEQESECEDNLASRSYELADKITRLEEVENDLSEREQKISKLEEELELQKNQTDKLDEEIISLREQQRSDSDVNAEHSNEIESELAKERLALKDFTKQNQNLQSKNEALALQVEGLEKQIEEYLKSDMLRIEEEAKKTARSRMAKQIQEPKNDFEELRLRLHDEITRVDQLLIERKSLFEALKARNSRLILSLTPLRVNSGVSLDRIRFDAQQVENLSDYAVAHTNLSGIEKILLKDISILRRVR